MECLACGGKGSPGGCKICGKELQTYIFLIPEEASPEILAKIPKAYREPWNIEVLREKYSAYMCSQAAKNYFASIDNLVTLFSRGQLPRKTNLITSSVGLGKTRLAYTCMTLAEAHGFTVGPLIDNTEYRRLNNLSTDVQLYKDFLKYNKHLPNIEVVTQSDVQFMTIDPTNFKDAYLDILSLVSKRDRQGKSTIVISCFTVDQLAMFDRSKQFVNSVLNTKLTDTKQIKLLELFLG